MCAKEQSRSLHWERGLKPYVAAANAAALASLPSLGAWIETYLRVLKRIIDESLPSLGAWIETLNCRARQRLQPSRSLHWERGLKPVSELRVWTGDDVAPFIGSVD